MPLHLRSIYDGPIPIEVMGIVPESLAKMSNHDIAGLPVWRGRRQQRLDHFFKIEGSAESDQTIHWSGPLATVHRIGQGMASGSMHLAGTAGDHTGEAMSGGRLTVEGDVGDYAGCEMTGGRITVQGNAGHWLGSGYPGAKLGMNRGEILVLGNAGDAVGIKMRRGLIVVQGHVGNLCGWKMLAGTIITFGGWGDHAGADMKRGTLIDASGGQATRLLPSFSPGPIMTLPILPLLQRYLQSTDIDAQQLSRLADPFQIFHGDRLQGGRGELFRWHQPAA